MGRQSNKIILITGEGREARGCRSGRSASSRVQSEDMANLVLFSSALRHRPSIGSILKPTAGY